MLSAAGRADTIGLRRIRTGRGFACVYAALRQQFGDRLRGSYAHRLVRGAFAGEEVDASLFTGPQRAGLTRGETALLRLLKRKAEK
jgi:hypothetical protein